MTRTAPTNLEIEPGTCIPLEEVELSAIRSRGPGGQNVNKVSSAVHLRFDVRSSSLPDEIKQRLMEMRDHRISAEGVIVIKAQRRRTQEKNRVDAIDRLLEILRRALVVPRERRPTRPTRSSQRRRLDSKAKRGKIKALRGRVEH